MTAWATGAPVDLVGVLRETVVSRTSIRTHQASPMSKMEKTVLQELLKLEFDPVGQFRKLGRSLSHRGAHRRLR
jgi:hypothetical protein